MIGELAIDVAAFVKGGVIRRPSVPGQLYTIESCDDLKQADWTFMATVTVAANVSEMIDPAANTTEHRIYRVRWTK